MGMWDFDLGGKTAEEIEQSAGKMQPGYYRFKFKEAKVSNENASVGLACLVTHGPLTGRVHMEYLKSPAMCNTTEESAVVIKKAMVYLKRFGLVPRDATKVVNPDWSKLVGVEGVMKVVHRTWGANAERGKEAGEKTEIDFGGCWPMGHPELTALPKDIRAALGLGPPAGSAATEAGSGTITTTAPTPPTAEQRQEMARKLWD